MNKSILVIEPDDIKYKVLNDRLIELGYSEEHIFRQHSFPECASIDTEIISVIVADVSSEPDILSPYMLLKHSSFTFR